MRERWVDDVLGSGESMSARADERLRAELSAMWEGENAATFSMEPAERPPSPGRRWNRAWLVAAALLLVAVVGIVVLRDPSTTVDQPIGPDPTITTFDSLPGPIEPITPEAIVDITWRVDDIDDQPPVTAAPWFRLEPDGTVEGFDGCHWYTAAYELEGDQLDVARDRGVSLEGCPSTEWHSTQVATGTLTLAGETLIARGTDASRDGARRTDVELRASGIETLPADVESVPGRYVDETVEHEILFRDDGTIDEPGGCAQIGRWRIEDGLVIETDLSEDDPCRAVAVEGRGGVMEDGGIVVFNVIEPRLPEITTFRSYDIVDASFDYALDVEVPPDGGEPLRPEVFANVASDAGADGPPLIAVFPDDILNVRDLDGTLVGFGHDRLSGEPTRRVLIDGASQRPLRIFGSSTGVLYAQLDECTYGAFAEREATDAFELVERVDHACGTSTVKVVTRVVPAGLEVGGNLVIESPVEPDPAPTVELGGVPVVIEDDNPDMAVISVERREPAGSERSWLGWVERSPDSSPGFTPTHLASFGRGAALGLFNDSAAILVTLGTDGDSRSYALGDWGIAGIDERGAVFWRQTPDDRGIEVARLSP